MVLWFLGYFEKQLQLWTVSSDSLGVFGSRTVDISLHYLVPLYSAGLITERDVDEFHK